MLHVVNGDAMVAPLGAAAPPGDVDHLDAWPLDWWRGGMRLEGRRVSWRRDTTAMSVVPARERGLRPPGGIDAGGLDGRRDVAGPGLRPPGIEVGGPGGRPEHPNSK